MRLPGELAGGSGGDVVKAKRRECECRKLWVAVAQIDRALSELWQSVDWHEDVVQSVLGAAARLRRTAWLRAKRREVRRER